MRTGTFLKKFPQTKFWSVARVAWLGGNPVANSGTTGATPAVLVGGITLLQQDRSAGVDICTDHARENTMQMSTNFKNKVGDFLKVPRIVSVEELPSTSVGGGVFAELAAMRGDATGPAGYGPVINEVLAPPPHHHRDITRPGPLSSKKRIEENEKGETVHTPLPSDGKESDGSVQSAMSVSSLASVSSKGIKRKRDRSSTTGMYVDRAATIKKLADEEQRLLELRVESEMANGD